MPNLTISISILALSVSAFSFFREKILTWMFRPKLDIEIVLRPPHCQRMQIQIRSEVIDATWFRFRVTNSKSTPASNVEVWLKKVEIVENGRDRDLERFPPVPLKWTHTGESSTPYLGMSSIAYVDFGFFSHTFNSTSPGFNFVTTPAIRDAWVETGSYKAYIQIGAANTYPREYVLAFNVPPTEILPQNEVIRIVNLRKIEVPTPRTYKELFVKCMPMVCSLAGGLILLLCIITRLGMATASGDWELAPAWTTAGITFLLFFGLVFSLHRHLDDNERKAPWITVIAFLLMLALMAWPIVYIHSITPWRGWLGIGYSVQKAFTSVEQEPAISTVAGLLQSNRFPNKDVARISKSIKIILGSVSIIGNLTSISIFSLLFSKLRSKHHPSRN